MDFSGIPEDSQEELQDDMVFRLDPLKVSEEEKGQTFGGAGDDPMWSSSSSIPEDWFFTGE